MEYDDRKGYVPSACLHIITEEEMKEDEDSDDEAPPQPQRTLMTRQHELEES